MYKLKHEILFGPSGDSVILLYIPQCEVIKFCRLTKGKGLMPEGTTRFSRGKSLFHFMGCSTFTATVVAKISLAKVDHQAPLNKVCLLGCGITTGYGAALNTTKVSEQLPKHPLIVSFCSYLSLAVPAVVLKTTSCTVNY